MSRSRSRLAADWFAKLRINEITQELEHTDLVDLSDDVDTTLASTTASVDNSIDSLENNVNSIPNPVAMALIFGG
jgi:hypothetical protein